MSRCLKPRDIERFLTGKLSAHRMAAKRRHLSECKTCALALAEAEGNEEWLEGLRRTREVADLRDRIRYAKRQPPAPATELTNPPQA